MEIGIVALMRTLGGSRTYSENLIRALLAIDPQNKYTVLTDDLSRFADLGHADLILLNLPTRYLLPWWEYIHVPLTLRKRRLDLVHHTKGVLPPFIHSKSVVTLHDISPFVCPETFSAYHRFYLQRNITRAVQKADSIITDSESAKRDILQFFKISEKKIRVIYISVSEHFKPIKDPDFLNSVRKRYGLPEKMILYVGTLQPRKNVDILIRAYHQLRKEKKSEHQLVIVGRVGWMVQGLKTLVHELGEETNIIFTGAVRDEEVPAFYNLSDVLVYPSSYEGFGLPILEAMASGIPVISCKISSIPEVAGDAGLLVPPRDVTSLADAIRTVLSDGSLRSSLIQKGFNQVKKFSWHRCANETLKHYSEVYQS
jgi:glycosyltransferase involved in cell wall biosynthesis